jgi:hypothetical protein
MEFDLQSLFGLLCTAVLIGWDPATPPSPAFGLMRVLLVSQDKRHLFVTPCKCGIVGIASQAATILKIWFFSQNRSKWVPVSKTQNLTLISICWKSCNKISAKKVIHKKVNKFTCFSSFNSKGKDLGLKIFSSYLVCTFSTDSKYLICCEKFLSVLF